jgi:nicotinamidase/pyrazinamidase
MPGAILWDVDTQVDLMELPGKLHVPGAKDVMSAMERLVDAARAASVTHVASADDHELTDPEICDQPDFRDTYPPHCLRGTRGATNPNTAALLDALDPAPRAPRTGASGEWSSPRWTR